jgi:hypothetical protein
MKRFLLTVVPLLFLDHSRAAVAIVDVDSPWGGTKTFLAAYGQTFTPTVDGALVGLRLNVTSSSPFTVTLWDYHPTTGLLGNILGSQSFSTTKVYSGGYGWAEVAFQTNIQQFAGKPMAFTVTSSGSPVPGPAISSTSMYSGGAFFEYSGSSSVTLIARDLNFQTLVVPVPEPNISLFAGFAFLFWSIHRKNR